MAGQIADGIAIIFFGLYMDKTESKIGKRHPWYIFGTLFTIPSFVAFFAYPDFRDSLYW